MCGPSARFSCLSQEVCCPWGLSSVVIPIPLGLGHVQEDDCGENTQLCRLWRHLDVKSSGFITLDNWDPQAFRVLMEFRETLGGFWKSQEKSLVNWGDV